MAAELYVLDAFALMTHLERGRGHAKVMALLESANAGRVELLISDINLGEVYYVIKQRLGETAAENMLLDVDQLPVLKVAATWERIHRAAQIKGEGGLSYADAFAAGLAQEANAVLVTGDKEFLRWEGRIKLNWLC